MMEDEWFLSQPCTVFVFLKRRAHELIQRSVSRKGLHNGLMFQKYTFSIKSVTDFGEYFFLRISSRETFVVTRRNLGICYFVCSRDHHKSKRRCSCKYIRAQNILPYYLFHIFLVMFRYRIFCIKTIPSLFEIVFIL